MNPRISGVIMNNSHPATFTRKGGTKLNDQDIVNICNDVQQGVPYRELQKKYKIGGGRLARILKICNVRSIVGGNWEQFEIPSIEENSVDSVLSKQIDNMKKSMDNIKLKSFI